MMTHTHAVEVITNFIITKSLSTTLMDRIITFQRVSFATIYTYIYIRGHPLCTVDDLQIDCMSNMQSHRTKLYQWLWKLLLQSGIC